MQIINPATEEIIGEIPEDNKESLRIKFQLLKKAQSDWAALEIKQRVKILQNFSRALSSLWPTKIANIVRVRPLKFDFSEPRREIQLLTRTGRYAQSHFAKCFEKSFKIFQTFYEEFCFSQFFEKRLKNNNYSVTHCTV